THWHICLSRPDTISTDNHPELSPVATVSPGGIFRRLPRGRRQARKNLEEETPTENDLTIKGKAYIAGIYEHPTRHAPDKSTAQLHAEVAKGAIEDAGLTKADIDGYFCAGDAPGAEIAVDVGFGEPGILD